MNEVQHPGASRQPLLFLKRRVPRGVPFSTACSAAWQLLRCVIPLVPMLLPAVARAQEGLVASGGGRGPLQAGPCISQVEEMRILSEVASFTLLHPESLAVPELLPAPVGTTPYPFYPQAGKLWEDLFPNNFVDLNPASPAILDYNGTAYTYDGHQGIDSDLCTFTEQSIGVPVFAALDGVVTAAHDGEFDMNTTQVPGAPANYVVLRHAGTHDTWYYHLKKNSVAVTTGQTVKAGAQLGLTASSGFSTGPHLHFQSVNNGTHYEAFSGPFNPGSSGWVNQIPFRSEMYVRDFNITTQNLSGWSGPPTDTTRTGTFVGTGVKSFYFWSIVQSLRANSTYRIRFLRPNGTQRFDSGTFNFGGGSNPFYKWSYWWWSYNINFDAVGTWTLELSINGNVAVQAPMTITSGAAVNRPPENISAAFDPPQSYASGVIFCRVPFRLIDDPDYDVVRYRYLWSRNGVIFRDVTNASLADAIPAGSCAPGELLTCTVTPGDGQTTATPAVISTHATQTFAEWSSTHGLSAASLTEDEDEDGLPNLVEFAINTSPTSPNWLPAPTRKASGVLEWQLPKNDSLDTAITCFVESSTNLLSWQPATYSLSTGTWTAGGSLDTQRFLRVKVTVP
jgi:hypothetical protein